MSVTSESSTMGSGPAVGCGELGLRRRVALLPSDGRAAAGARSVVRSVCARWGVEGVVKVAVACASELAANAVRHVAWGRVPLIERVMWLVVELWGPLLVVEVRDPGGALPVVGERIDFSGFGNTPADMSPLPESGLGLRMVVDQVEQADGMFGAVELPRGGKSVFFAVPWEAQR